MTPEAKAAALARLAADTKRACATSADIAKAAKARAAAQAAHAAKAAKAAQAAKAQAEAAQAAKAAKLAKVAKTSKAAKVAKAAVNPVAKGFAYHAKAAFLTHPVYFSLAGGVIIGIVAYRLANKYWLNKDDTA
ncbi:MAG: hypothetical protein KZQ83_05465 [gamma proteobacterium symbiont of Taylorina sp.]|nr:hypothetical protein [gamma proteobacterium symbiont of Taylorina sp.]